ncbi:MAG TPA: hypothetical protein H9902_03850 [Candidatus Stackebrandtia faecavium]|nr:hypothetical protein [Candidatus Stackebrandtia faecavium]
MQDAWRAYLELALGLTEASRKKATKVVKSLAEQSGEKVEDLQSTVEGLIAASAANRDSMSKLVRYELDRALGKVGLATGEEVAELNARVQQLEIELLEAKEQAAAAQEDAAQSRTASGTAGANSTKKSAAKKASAGTKKATTRKKATTKKTAAKKAAKSPAKTTSTKKATAKKAAKKQGSSGGRK